MRRATTLIAIAVLAACWTAPDRLEDATELATFGAGCFWCSEAAFEQLEGVLDVTSGFMGGQTLADPTADDLIAAGHAEVVQVEFDPTLISYEELLTWFWTLHDPTSINKQGEDEGPEYRSVIYAHSDAQLRAATASRKDVQANEVRPIVTGIEASSVFYPASQDHQDYYARNKGNAQCQTVIGPHLEAVGLER